VTSGLGGLGSSGESVMLSLEGEAKVEHEADGRGVALLGRTYDRCTLIVDQPGDQSGIVGESPQCRRAVGL
jgi:hypothetical protein